MLLKIHIDRKVSVDISHLVLESFRHADDEVVDDGADCAESCDGFAAAVVHFDVDDGFAGVGEADGQVVEVFGEFAAGAFDGDDAGFNCYFDCGEKPVLVWFCGGGLWWWWSIWVVWY